MSSTKESPFLFNCHDLPRRAGEMREYSLTISEHESMGLPFFAIPDSENIEVELQISAVSEGILATASVRAHAVGECTRCLDPIALDLDEEFNELYIYESDPRSRSSKRHHKEDREIVVDDEEELLSMHGDYIDLEGPIRDSLILNLPVNPLCSVDCLGLCPGCGVKWEDLPESHGHEEIDIRWAGLKGIGELNGLENPAEGGSV